MFQVPGASIDIMRAFLRVVRQRVENTTRPIVTATVTSSDDLEEVVELAKPTKA
jgi:hypothetical protein